MSGSSNRSSIQSLVTLQQAEARINVLTTKEVEEIAKRKWSAGKKEGEADKNLQEVEAKMFDYKMIEVLDYVSFYALSRGSRRRTLLFWIISN